ncbi:hypothetical protein LY78DRAFT_710772 [Colletotrichum sublineola]|nr:hypothetical protein LY78DRAFT_710772 [Colletotrichum sublineola]
MISHTFFCLMILISTPLIVHPPEISLQSLQVLGNQRLHLRLYLRQQHVLLLAPPCASSVPRVRSSDRVSEVVHVDDGPAQKLGLLRNLVRQLLVSLFGPQGRNTDGLQLSEGCDRTE